MMLFVDGISSGIECPNVGYCIENYESAFELLTGLVADKWILRYAIVISDGDSLKIPLEAFDGQPIRVHIQALQKEWNQILAAKPDYSAQVGSPRLKNHFLQLDKYYVSLLEHLDKMNFLLEINKNKIERRRNRELGARFASQYSMQLDLNRKMYQHTKEYRQRNLLRISMLENQQH